MMVFFLFISSRILENDESINPVLYQRLEKSFLSIPNVSNVKIFIDNELIEEDKNVSSTIDNIIQI